HPWIYREALKGPPRGQSGEVVDVGDSEGHFVARALWDPDSPVALRVLSRDENEAIDAEFFRRRIARAVRLRNDFVELEATNAYRLVNGESDGLPAVIVEKYANFVVVQLLSSAWERHAQPLYDALFAELAPVGIYEQRRFRPASPEAPRGPAELVRGA